MRRIIQVPHLLIDLSVSLSQRFGTTANISTASVPPHLRHGILPSIRKLHLESPSAPANSSTPSGSELETENARLRAENAALRKNCSMWRKRAEAHSSSTLGLLHLVRMAQDQAMQVARERDELSRRCDALQRRLDHHEGDPKDDDQTDDLEEFSPAAMLGQVDKIRTNYFQRLSSSGDDAFSPSLEEAPCMFTLKRPRTPHTPPYDDEGDSRPSKRSRKAEDSSPLPSLLLPDVCD
ncbi:hypothetical protein AX17_005928 [Amanita inopinata Kibby_2008]|nr:hypothetical protein AX17_005928 [Amanita inopinata Kibby_2008]